VVPKVSFSEPVAQLESNTFTLADSAGNPIPAWVDQIGDGTWALFAHSVFLTAGETYSARLSAGICSYSGICTKKSIAWSFKISSRRGQSLEDTSVPLGFPAVAAPHADSRPTRRMPAERNGAP